KTSIKSLQRTSTGAMMTPCSLGEGWLRRSWRSTCREMEMNSVGQCKVADGSYEMRGSPRSLNSVGFLRCGDDLEVVGSLWLADSRTCMLFLAVTWWWVAVESREINFSIVNDSHDHDELKTST